MPLSKLSNLTAATGKNMIAYECSLIYVRTPLIYFPRHSPPTESGHQRPNPRSRLKRSAEPILITHKSFFHECLCLCSSLHLFDWHFHGQSWLNRSYCVWVLSLSFLKGRSIKGQCATSLLCDHRYALFPCDR